MTRERALKIAKRFRNMAISSSWDAQRPDIEDETKKRYLEEVQEFNFVAELIEFDVEARIDGYES